MTYTSHGHHIHGTEIDTPPPSSPKRCGGPNYCSVCKHEAIAVLAEKTKKEETKGT